MEMQEFNHNNTKTSVILMINNEIHYLFMSLESLWCLKSMNWTSNNDNNEWEQWSPTPPPAYNALTLHFFYARATTPSSAGIALRAFSLAQILSALLHCIQLETLAAALQPFLILLFGHHKLTLFGLLDVQESLLLCRGLPHITRGYCWFKLRIFCHQIRWFNNAKPAVTHGYKEVAFVERR